MKFNLTKWILTGNIYPLKWGDSEVEIANFLKGTEKEIKRLKKRDYPLIILDFVEFYFEGEIYNDLSEISIGSIYIHKEMESKYFEIDWLRRETTYEEVLEFLKQRNISYKTEKRGINNNPIILISSNVTIVFEQDTRSNIDNKANLYKIYIQSEAQSEIDKSIREDKAKKENIC